MPMISRYTVINIVYSRANIVYMMMRASGSGVPPRINAGTEKLKRPLAMKSTGRKKLVMSPCARSLAYIRDSASVCAHWRFRF